MVVGRTLVAVRDWTFVLGPILMAALNALMFGTLLYRGRLVPRAIPAIGLVGAPVAIAFVIATTLGFSELGSTFQGIAGAPFFIWELAVGLWMIFKGFNRTAPGRGGCHRGGRAADLTGRHGSVGCRGHGEGRCGMTAAQQQEQRTPPRFLVRTFWATPPRGLPAQRRPARPEAARGGRAVRLHAPDAPSDGGRARHESPSSGTSRTARTSSPWP